VPALRAAGHLDGPAVEVEAHLAQIRKGSLRPGEELPSIRELASTLGINLHTAHRAYQVLRDEGVIVLRLGRRPRVAALREVPAGRREVQQRLAGRLNELSTEAFHLGL
jgi:GntR family transcriptional regulator